MNTLMLEGRQVTLVDTHVNADPTAEQLAEITLMAAEALRRIGVEPKVALLSHSNFGTSNLPSAVKMREALALIRERAPELEIDGEMHGDTALDSQYRERWMPRSTCCSAATRVRRPETSRWSRTPRALSLRRRAARPPRRRRRATRCRPC